MEAEEIGDLRDGPVVVAVDDVSVSLWIDGDGHPQVGRPTTSRMPGTAPPLVVVASGPVS